MARVTIRKEGKRWVVSVNGRAMNLAYSKTEARRKQKQYQRQLHGKRTYRGYPVGSVGALKHPDVWAGKLLRKRHSKRTYPDIWARDRTRIYGLGSESRKHPKTITQIAEERGF